MIQSRSNIAIIGAVAFIGILAPLFAYWGDWITGMDVRMILSAYAPLSTILLVLVTWYYNQEARKDRRRPLKIDELQRVVVPSIRTMNKNQRLLENGTFGFDADRSYPNNLRISAVKSSIETNNASITQDRFQRESPELYEKIERHDELIEDIEKYASLIYQNINDSVEASLREDSERYDVNYEHIVVSNIIRGLIDSDQPDTRAVFGDSNTEFWEEELSEYQHLMAVEAKNELQSLHNTRKNTIEMIEKLNEQLKSKLDHEQKKYGISDGDIEN